MDKLREYEDAVTESFVQIVPTQVNDVCSNCFDLIGEKEHIHICFRKEGHSSRIRRLCNKKCLDEYFDTSLLELEVAAFAIKGHRQIR